MSLDLAIRSGDIEGARRALQADRAVANRTIRWFLNQTNESDPLHYVSDCVSHEWLTNGTAGEIAKMLLAHGAAVDGTDGRESPLIASVSLGAASVSRVLIEAGAQLEVVSVFGARALHWAAWMGAASTVELLLARGAEIEVRCTEFGATPLFWAVHGYGRDGPDGSKDQVAAARLLIKAGANVATANKHGLTALELSRQNDRPDMYEVLRQYSAPE